jgi:hypothetical protein
MQALLTRGMLWLWIVSAYLIFFYRLRKQLEALQISFGNKKRELFALPDACVEMQRCIDSSSSTTAPLFLLLLFLSQLRSKPQ